jgi:hypothetical protein
MMRISIVFFLLSSLLVAICTHAFVPNANTIISPSTWNKEKINSHLFAQTSDVQTPHTTFLSRFDGNIPKKALSRRKRLQKKVKTVAASLAIYSTILLRTPKAAVADHPLQNTPSGKISLRPGVTVDQLETEAQLRNTLTIDEQIARQAESKPSTASTAKPKKTKAAPKKAKFDFDDEYEFDDDDVEEDDIGSPATSLGDVSAKALDLQSSSSARAVSRFSGSGPAMSEEKKNKELGITVAKIMGPIFAFCFTRETIRWNREQKNVNKGIEIMEQQKQEYLKLKKDGDDDDDDDDDDEVRFVWNIVSSFPLV